MKNRLSRAFAAVKIAAVKVRSGGSSKKAEVFHDIKDDVMFYCALSCFDVFFRQNAAV